MIIGRSSNAVLSQISIYYYPWHAILFKKKTSVSYILKKRLLRDVALAPVMQSGVALASFLNVVLQQGHIRPCSRRIQKTRSAS